MRFARMDDYSGWDGRMNRVEALMLSTSETTVHSIATPAGIVVADVMRSRSHAGIPIRYTRLRFVFGRRQYFRSWKVEWAPRTISRLAREMAWEISGGW